MILRRGTLLLLILLVAGGSTRLCAQELTFLGGFLPEVDHERSSYTWQVDYRQDFARYFAGSIAYINEGHLRAHHRDGTAAEAWGRLPFDHDRFIIGLGVGGYAYFDTQPVHGGDTADVHGTALIASLSATAYFSDRWFGEVMVNRILPDRDIDLTTVSAGVGFWFGRTQKPTPGKLGDAPDEEQYVTANELTAFTGQSVVNTFLSQKAAAWAGEYRHGLIPHLDWTVSAIYEGDPKIIRRSGGASQVWAVNNFFHNRVAVGAGIGPYVYLDHKNPPPSDRRIPAAVAPLFSLTLAYRLSDSLMVRAVFDRVVSNYNRDSDIFLIGLGYRWGR
ncbi:MAG TPA: hypothetical protein VHD32_09735 [Candidatus Didemnitutus sp.]|nr:hypothetical protein [Candidatus Didemnitutus sp.]